MDDAVSRMGRHSRFREALQDQLQLARIAANTALQGKKLIVFIGGFGDRTGGSRGPIYGKMRGFKGQFGNAQIGYFTKDDKSKAIKWIHDMCRELKCDPSDIAIVGHSLGGDTAASIVADGMRVGALVTVDPVSVIRPDFAKVRENAGQWININANPTDETRSHEFLGNALAGFGNDWSNAPAGYAAKHFNADFNHENVREILPYKSVDSSGEEDFYEDPDKGPDFPSSPVSSGRRPAKRMERPVMT